jgi:hypothetical protein
MKVYYEKGKHVIVFFPAREMKQALGVLKAMAHFFKADFLFKVAGDVERDLTPTQYHLCENCCMEIDTRVESYLHVDDTYYHQLCPTLKENRPV